ncbi:MAG: peptidoglycan editing factor PgeF [Deltaproteobacteria bacterium]|nr:peptidoglycan editing factor PgeF [Deltaproteobacteria bacterium]
MLPNFSVLSPWNFPHLVHGFMTREGGVSQGSYRSFNLAEYVGDDVSAVTDNWARWRAAYPRVRPVRLQQVHGNCVHSIGAADDRERKIGDGIVTKVPGIVLAIFTADCVPILMTDSEARVVGALHAGWRGVLAGIAGVGLNAMVALGARLDQVQVALGPAIGSCCFEVDAQLADYFVGQLPNAASSCRPGRPGKQHLGLRAILRTQLQEAGVGEASIVETGPCTRCNSERFFSRRAAAGAATGLQMSFIGFDAEQ